MGRPYVGMIVLLGPESELISCRFRPHGIDYIDPLLGSESPSAVRLRRRAPSLRHSPIHVLWLFLGQSC